MDFEGGVGGFGALVQDCLDGLRHFGGVVVFEEGYFRDVVGIGSREYKYEHETRDRLILFIILCSVFGDLGIPILGMIGLM